MVLLIKLHNYYFYAIISIILKYLIYQLLAYLRLNNIKLRNIQIEGGKCLLYIYLNLV